jgi:DNA invertase Pin-like site-specific DNA recombinase
MLITKAVVYTRFSPGRNSAHSESCETQLEYCEKYAKEHDMDIVEVFRDKAISGKDEKRRKLWEAVGLLDKGDVLLVYKRDRLARNVFLAELLRREVEERGARIVAASGDIEGNSPEQVMVRQMMAAFAEFERENGRARTSDAMQRHMRSGRRMGRHPPYGYDIDPEDPTRLKIRQDERPAVRMIAQLVDQNLPTLEIVRFMNRDDDMLALARGAKWHRVLVDGVIRRL